MKLVSIILCGGAGSRLWPLSREMQPKPFIRMDDGLSLLQKAFSYAQCIREVSEVVAVTNFEYNDKTAVELIEKNKKALQLSFISESKGRNTAPAITSAVLYLKQKYGDDTILLIQPSDHLIQEPDKFAQAVQEGAELAKQGKIVTFGIKPTAPETGYGYIEVDGDKVLRFVEKPSIENAENYIASGKFLWNSGIYCFSVGTFINHMHKHYESLLKEIKNCLDNSVISSKTIQKQSITDVILDKHLFESIEENSIEYALLEKDPEIFVIPCEIGWSDVGSWTSFGNLYAADSDGNRVVGDVEIIGSKNCTIYGQDRLVGAIGIKDAVIVDTRDALLVAKKSEVGKVRELYSMLKRKGHNTHKEHQTVHRDWGSYTLIESGQNYAIKRMVVKPRGRQGLQMHHHRNEHWVVVSGIGRVTNGKDVYFITVQQSTFISAGSKHRLENPGQVPLIIIETQTGDYINESDIVRFDD